MFGLAKRDRKEVSEFGSARITPPSFRYNYDGPFAVSYRANEQFRQTQRYRSASRIYQKTLFVTRRCFCKLGLGLILLVCALQRAAVILEQLGEQLVRLILIRMEFDDFAEHLHRLVVLIRQYETRGESLARGGVVGL